eukprot:scaffold21057_cov63-Cyclotella_meneghiniana.AAC.3
MSTFGSSTASPLSLPSTASPPSLPSTSNTKSGRQVDSIKELHEARHRLNNVKNEIGSFVTLMKDESARKSDIKTSARNVETCVLPALQKIMQSMNNLAKELAPIPALKETCDELERYQVKSIVNPHKRKSPDAQILQHFITPSKSQAPEQPKRPRLSRSSNESNSDISHICLPTPTNATQYTVTEAISIIVSNTSHGSKERGSLIKKLVDEQLVPCQSDWKTKGRPRIVDNTTLGQAVDKLESASGSTLGKKQIEKFLVDEQKKKKINKGLMPFNVPDKMSRSSLNRYGARLALNSRVTIADKTIRKTNTRFAAENSLRGAFNLVLTAAVANFTQVDVEDATQMLKTIWLLCQRAPHCCINDTTVYTFEGSDDGPDKFVLAAKNSCENRGTHSLYTVNEGKDMNGMRVKLSFSFNAIGASSPLYITVSGLTDEEMPMEEDMLVVEVPGLCVGGGVGSNDSVGYIVFTKKNSGADQLRFEHYHKHILKPMVDEYRKRLYDYDPDSGTEIPRELFAVACSDGDMPQVKAVASNDPHFFIENLIVVMKQNAARTGVEQPADLAKVFKVIKLLTPSYTVSNIDPSDHPLKKLIWQAFHSGELKCLNLNDKKRRSIIDFIPSFVDMAGKALTERNVRHGFIESGMIDEDKLKYPVLEKILATCKSEIAIDLYETFIANFTRLYKLMFENGHVPDEVYDELGFPKDKDVNGNDVLREAGILQESQQRSKILTHPEQCRARQERLDRIQADRRRIDQEQREKASNKIEYIRAIRDKLKNMLFQDRAHDTNDLELCTLEHFFALSVGELAEFIVAHDPNFPTKSTLKGWRMGKSNSDKEAQMQALDNNTPSEVRSQVHCSGCLSMPCSSLQA